MPSKKQYNLVNDDAYDSRIPLHSEEAFHHGITFQVKYIGSLDVVRPSSRVEIVAAMRRVRYEFKAKAIKKRKVIIDVSVEGVKINARRKKKRNDRYYDDKILLMHHPVYRIFYVSHDSQDLKIFSYIARDGSSNVFKCNVFKSKRKSQALRIVRTVGQAFEVCHKLSLAQNSHNDEEKQEDIESEQSQEASNDTAKKLKPTSDRVSEPNSCDTQTEEIPNETSAMPTSPTPAEAQPQRPIKLEPLPVASSLDIGNHAVNDCGELYSSPMNETLMGVEALPAMSGSLSAYHELHLAKQLLEQQKQQTQIAVSQVRLLRDQLQAESAARIESQARAHQLLVHNNDLLEHIQNLVKQLQDFELKIVQNKDQEKSGASKDSVSISSQPIQILCDAATPSSTAIVLPPDLQDLDSSHQHQHDHLLAGVYDSRNASNMLGVGAGSVFEQPASARIPKSLDTVSVSSLSSCAFSRSPSFRMSTSPNIINDDAHHQSIPNMLSTSNQNYLRLNSIPVNSTSPLMNQSSFPETARISNDISRTQQQLVPDQTSSGLKQNLLSTPSILTSSLQPVSLKHKVTRHSSSDDAVLLHQNSNDQDVVSKQVTMSTSRTVPTISSSFLENVTADIGHSYGRQYSLNLKHQQNQQNHQNLAFNFADMSVNDAHDSPRSRTLAESSHRNAEPTSPRYNCINSEDELTRSSSFRKSFHKK